jgi:hypothetical protein
MLVVPFALLETVWNNGDDDEEDDPAEEGTAEGTLIILL